MPVVVGDEAFRAIGDPTRRAILDMLAQRDCSVGELCASFPISQSAVSQHLRVLREAGLVTPRQEGRLRVYRLEPAPLQAIYEWVEHYQRFWASKLGALGRYLDEGK
jgi:DNA-binding transcriptional ArsR family regulator